MEYQVQKTIKKYQLLKLGQTVVVAVSGGPDSVVLLDLLVQQSNTYNLKLHVAHLNHMFRGKQAEEEAEFVRTLAQKYRLGYSGEARDVPRFIAETGLSPQDAARQMRYQFLHQVAAQIQADVIATGHHADDQAETVLLHLVRGAGTEGLAAMAPKAGRLIRPLLEVRRDEILAYCKKNGLEFRLDPSNDQGYYLRNRLRLELMPRLAELNPQVIAALGATANICREENDLLEQMTGDILKKLGFLQPGRETVINLDLLRQYHIALQRRVIRQVYDLMAGTKGGLGHWHTGEILDLRSGKEITLPHGLFAYREYQNLVLTFQSRLRVPHSNVTKPIPLPVPGQTNLPGLNITLEASIVPAPGPVGTPFLGVFSAALRDKPLMIRTRRDGDRFQPRGFAGTKKLKDFFIDQKVPPAKREHIPLVFAGNELIWVVGYRTSARFEPTPQDREVVLISVKNADRS